MKQTLVLWAGNFLRKNRMTSSLTWLIFQRKPVIVGYDFILPTCLLYVHNIFSARVCDCCWNLCHFHFLKCLCVGLACILQINEFVKRARAAKIHAYIISHLRKEMPAMMGKAKAQQRLIDNLEDEFAKVNIWIFLCACRLPYKFSLNK